MLDQLRNVIDVILKAKELIVALIFILGVLSEPFSPDVSISYSFQEVYSTSLPNSPGKTLFDATIENNTSDEVSDIEFFVKGVSSIDSISYKTSSKRLAESLSDSFKYAIEDDVLYLKDFVRLPPGHNLRVQFVAEYDEPFFSSPVEFTSSADDVFVESKGFVSGWWVFLYNWSYIWIPLVLVSLILLTAYRVLSNSRKGLM